MPRIIKTEVICLASERYRESSKVVTLFSRNSGKLMAVAKGARRPKSRFGAALERFAVSRVTFYWHENRTRYTLSDAELIRSFPALAELPQRYLAAEQITEFLLRTGRPFDPAHYVLHEGTGQLFRLTTAYLEVLEASKSNFRQLVASYLLKAASFLGFRPELERCVLCRRMLSGHQVSFDSERGGTVCQQCRPAPKGRTLSEVERRALAQLLRLPAARLGAASDIGALDADFLPLALEYVSSHLDPLILNSFRWETL
ncbi:MAG: DNA repair protein RecO [candidate division WOR-3 bacterium]